MRKIVLFTLCAGVVMLSACADSGQSVADSASSAAVSAESAQSVTEESERTAPAQASTEAESEPAPSEETAAEPSSPETIISGDGGLADIRAEIGGEELFAAAYLGYFPAAQTAPLAEWLRGSSPNLLTDAPFIAEIPEERTIGSTGYLFCIIPRDEAASAAVNRVSWNDDSQSFLTDEVLYRSESGEPLLVFCNVGGNTDNPDTAITVVSGGAACEWQPMLNAYGRISLPISADGAELAADVTNYNDRQGAVGMYLEEGWAGPTAEGLSADGATWTAQTLAWDGAPAQFELTFRLDGTGAGASVGSVSIDRRSAGETEYEECWSGWWSITTELEQPSFVTLELSRSGGRNFDETDAPMFISDTYPVLISPSGEQLMLFGGAHSIPLPFMPSGDSAALFTAAMG